MHVLIAILTLLLVTLVVLLVSAPLRRPAGDSAAASPADASGAATAERRSGELEELEAAREAKYREIRDCELDFRTGKLSREDFEITDAQLRTEALLILDRLEAVGGPQASGTD